MMIEVDAKTNKMILHTHNENGELIQSFDANEQALDPAPIETNIKTEEQPKATTPKIQSNTDGSIEIKIPFNKKLKVMKNDYI
jgi:hypothetical protein